MNLYDLVKKRVNISIPYSAVKLSVMVGNHSEIMQRATWTEDDLNSKLNY